jgi:hypothetical protein
MTITPTSTRLWHRAASVLLLLIFAAVAGQAAEMKIETQLVWGTNDPQSPDSKHKLVDQEIQKKLDELPLKWANYFQICKKRFQVPQSGAKKVTISDKCEIEVRDIDGKKMEVSLIGKNGETVLKRTQPLPKGDILVLGGNAPNATAWFVTLKRVE